MIILATSVVSFVHVSRYSAWRSFETANVRDNLDAAGSMVSFGEH